MAPNEFILSSHTYDVGQGFSNSFEPVEPN